MFRSKQTRRSFISKLALASCGMTFSNELIRSNNPFPVTERKTGDKMLVCAFSKIFDQLGNDMFAFLADSGFEGVDLTVRRGGYINPENVEKELPKAVEEAYKRGLSIPMIATDIDNANDAVNRNIIKAASDAKIKYYRLKWFKYNPAETIEQNLENFRKRLIDLCDMNSKYNIHGGYQNHEGAMFGSAVWDLWYLIKDLDPSFIGCQYDIHHAVIEGFKSWPLGLKAMAPYIKHLCVKDFIYLNDGGKYKTKSVPLSTGAVDFNTYFNLLRQEGVSGPISLHFEHPLLSKSEMTMSVNEKIKKMRPEVEKEVNTLKQLMSKATNA